MSVILLVLSVIDAVSQIGLVFPVYITTSVIKIITYLVVLSLQWTCKKCGLVTSAILLLFWTLSTVAGTFTFISVLRSGHLSAAAADGEDKVVLPLITATIQYPLVVSAFFFSCWSDPKPRYIDIDGE